MSHPDFDNTEIAFKAYSDHKLYESFLVYKSLGVQPLVDFGTFVINKALSVGLPIKPLVKHTVFKQFCGGEDTDDCFPIVEHMGSFGVGSILDYSVEALESEDGMDEVAEEICETIEYGSRRPYLPFAVFKITGVIPFALLEKKAAGRNLTDNEQAQWDRGVARYEKICETANHQDLRLLVDAEESWIQDTINELAEDAMRQYNKDRALIYNTLQMYRWDSIDYLRGLLDRGKSESFHVGAKLVRGAYMEKERERAKAKGYPSPIQPDKAATDRDFDAAVTLCLEHIGRVGLFVGTHNEESTRLTVEQMQAKGIAPQDPRVCFSQLYGMSENLSFNLAHHGYHTAKYLPYGPVKAVLPYLFRRAKENSSIKGQAGRELQLISKEVKRRKHQS